MWRSNLKEQVVVDLYQLIRSYFVKGIAIETWKLVGKVNEDIIWVENKKLDLRVRMDEPNATVHAYLGAQYNLANGRNRLDPPPSSWQPPTPTPIRYKGESYPIPISSKEIEAAFFRKSKARS